MNNTPMDPNNNANPPSGTPPKSNAGQPTSIWNTPYSELRAQSSSQPQAATPPPAPSEPETAPLPPFRRPAELLLAWGSLVLCFIFMQMRAFSAHPFGIFLSFAGIFLATIAYLRFSGIKGSRQSLALDIVTSIFSLALLTNGNAYVRGVVILALIFIFPYRIATACGIYRTGLLSDSVFRDVFGAYPILTFRHIKDFFGSLFGLRGKTASHVGKTLKWILLGLLIALIPTLIIILLLSYDSNFTDLLEKMFDFSIDWKDVSSVIFAIPCAMLLFGVLYTGNRIVAGEPHKTARTARLSVLPCILLCAAVTPILLVYILFFVSQAPYYLSAFTGTLPGDLSYASYAREGFFQLCTVSGINAVLLLLFSLFMKEGGRARDIVKRIYASLLSVFTLVLIATALSKMAIYIESYGLTQKRVYASWLMLLLAVAFILVLLRQFLPKFRLTAALVIAFLIFSAIITLPNIDGMIADYNVNAYIRGDLRTVDVQMLDQDLNESAAPALVRLKKHLEGLPQCTEEQGQTLEQTDRILHEMKKALSERSFTGFTIPSAIAKSALKEIE